MYRRVHDVDWSELIWKAAPGVISGFGVARSWRRQWKGPKGFLAWWRRRYHVERELFLTTQDRDYWKSQCEWFMEQSKVQKDLASYIESHTKSNGSSDPARPLLLPATTPTPRKRSRRPKRTLPTRTVSSPGEPGNGTGEAITPGHK